MHMNDIKIGLRAAGQSYAADKVLVHASLGVILPLWLQVDNAHHYDLLPRPHAASDAPAERHRLCKVR